MLNTQTSSLQKTSKTLLCLFFSFSFTQYTLETCETNIAENVPSFYHKYFECVTISMSDSGDYVNIYYNGVPPYETWYFEDLHPNNIPYASQGQGYYEVPGEIIEQDYVVSIPVAPQVRPDVRIESPDVNGEVDGSYQEYPMGSVGVALNGVNMFNPCASPPDVIEDEFFGFDYYLGHPAGASGIYHYHTKSQGPLEVLNHHIPDVVTNTTPGSAEIELYGLMCDGTLVFGCTELDGSMPESADWDAQNGHIHDIIDEDGVTHFESRYHTHVCFSEMTEEDADGNGFEDHEFTPEIAYYVSPSDMTYNILQGSNDNGLCGAMTNPYQPDMECADGSELDCNGLCESDGGGYGDILDACNICGGYNTADEDGFVTGPDADFFGNCCGEAFIDDCGICGGTNVEYEEGFLAGPDIDYLGECCRDQIIDDCGVCGGNGSSCEDEMPECFEDCSGECGGSDVSCWTIDQSLVGTWYNYAEADCEGNLIDSDDEESAWECEYFIDSDGNEFFYSDFPSLDECESECSDECIYEGSPDYIIFGDDGSITIEENGQEILSENEAWGIYNNQLCLLECDGCDEDDEGEDPDDGCDDCDDESSYMIFCYSEYSIDEETTFFDGALTLCSDTTFEEEGEESGCFCQVLSNADCDGVIDDCGICDGNGPSQECWDETVECSIEDCPDAPEFDFGLDGINDCLLDCPGIEEFANATDLCQWILAIDILDSCLADCGAYMAEGMQIASTCEYCLPMNNCDEQIDGDYSLSIADNEIIPSSFALMQSYPNPFNPSTVIRYAIPELSYVTIDIYNVNGHKVKNLVSGTVSPGYHEVTWNATLMPSGMYIVKFISEGFIQSQRVMLIK